MDGMVKVMLVNVESVAESGSAVKPTLEELAKLWSVVSKVVVVGFLLHEKSIYIFAFDLFIELLRAAKAHVDGTVKEHLREWRTFAFTPVLLPLVPVNFECASFGEVADVLARVRPLVDAELSRTTWVIRVVLEGFTFPLENERHEGEEGGRHRLESDFLFSLCESSVDDLFTVSNDLLLQRGTKGGKAGN